MRLKPPNHNLFLCAGALLVFALLSRPIHGAETVTLIFRNGDRITGTLTSEDTNRVVLSTPWIKELAIPAGQISKRELAAGQKPPAPAVGVGATAGTAAPELKRKPSRLLAGELNLGADLGFSEKNRQLYAGKAKVILAWERFKNTFDYDFSYGRTAGILSANRMDGFSKTDFDLGHRFYVYSLAGAGYDQIRNINLRYEVGPGLGYHLVQRTNLVVNPEFGVDYQAQDLADNTTTKLFFYRIAENMTWQLNSKLSMDEKFEFFPRVEQFDQYRFRFESNFRYHLMANLSLNLTVIDQYDTQPPDAVTRNDLQLRSSVGVKF